MSKESIPSTQIAELTLTALNVIQKSSLKSYEQKNKMISFATIQEQCVAEIVAQNIYQEIIKYQSKLPDETDVAMTIVNFNESITILVDSIGYIGYNLIRFGGKDNLGKPMELVQHVSQLNVLLTVVPKPEPEVPKRQIGFVGD